MGAGRRKNKIQPGLCLSLTFLAQHHVKSRIAEYHKSQGLKELYDLHSIQHPLSLNPRIGKGKTPPLKNSLRWTLHVTLDSSAVVL